MMRITEVLIYRLMIVLGVAVITVSCDPKAVNAAVEDILSDTSSPSKTRIAQGLKEALTKGVTRGSSVLSRVDGYYKSPYKILLPEEAQTVVDKLKMVPGFSNAEKITKKINRGSPKKSTEGLKEALPLRTRLKKSRSL